MWYRSIDLGGEWQDQVDAIDDLSRQATVFMSYAGQDAAIAEQMERKLRELDYHVADFRDMRASQRWTDVIHERIDTALANGSVVLLMSPDGMRSPYVVKEALYALQRCEDDAFNVKPFIIRDPQLVYAYLHGRPEWAPFRDIFWVELTDIDSLSLAELSRLIDPPR